MAPVCHEQCLDIGNLQYCYEKHERTISVQLFVYSYLPTCG